MRRVALAAVAVAAALVAAGLPSPAGAEGKYTRRSRARGEVTDTAPKLDRFAYINDAAPDPQRLVLMVDAWMARNPHEPRLLPLRIALAYEGHGKSLPINPGRFELTWTGAPAPVKALTHDQLVAACNGRTPVLHDLRLLSRRAGLSFDTPNAEPLFVQFYSHPALTTLRFDDMKLAARRWFSTLAYFPLPADFDRWGGLFELTYVPEDGGPAAVACVFRIERDPALQAEAMRRARKDLRDEQRGRQ